MIMIQKRLWVLWVKNPVLVDEKEDIIRVLYVQMRVLLYVVSHMDVIVARVRW